MSKSGGGLSFETRLNVIENNINKKIAIKQPGNKPYITTDEVVDTIYIDLDDSFPEKKGEYEESMAIFIPVNMERTAEIIEFQAKSVSTLEELKDTVMRRSKYFKFKSDDIEIFFNNKKLISNEQLKNSLQELIDDDDNNHERIYLGEGRNKKTVTKLAAILQKKEDDFELHLKPNKAQANKGNMVKQFTMRLPDETQRKTERYYGGRQFHSEANVWIGDMNNGMSMPQKLLAKEALWDLSLKFFASSLMMKKHGRCIKVIIPS